MPEAPTPKGDDEWLSDTAVAWLAVGGAVLDYDIASLAREVQHHREVRAKGAQGGKSVVVEERDGVTVVTRTVGAAAAAPSEPTGCDRCPHAAHGGVCGEAVGPVGEEAACGCPAAPSEPWVEGVPSHLPLAEVIANADEEHADKMAWHRHQMVAHAVLAHLDRRAVDRSAVTGNYSATLRPLSGSADRAEVDE